MVIGEGENPPPEFFHIIGTREEKSNTRLSHGEHGINEAIPLSRVGIPEEAMLAIAGVILIGFADEEKVGTPALEHRPSAVLPQMPVVKQDY
jgi:hypothetical protein